jgi:hypothetical protein
LITDGKTVEIASGEVPSLDPFQKTKLEMPCKQLLEPEAKNELKVTIFPEKQEPVTLSGKH